METPHGHLLVVEDDPEMRDLLKKVLEKAGHQVAAAGNGLEALALLPQQSFDLVVTDMRMPLGGGLSLLEAI
ncbi:MAG: response regulator, partial [Candidatus Methylomirabilota bacterium]